MDANEKLVRDCWEFGAIMVRGELTPRNGILIELGSERKGRLYFSKSEAWAAAADFTVQRKVKIADVERQIRWLETTVSAVTFATSTMVIRDGILSHLQAVLADLRRGWKG